jgi:hypothetical protein
VYFPEYALDLGAPTAELPADVSAYQWNGVYRRDFAKGMVLVNPSASPVTVTLPSAMRQASATGGGPVTDANLDAAGNYTGGSLAYAQVTSVTLDSRTAALFVAP